MEKLLHLLFLIPTLVFANYTMYEVTAFSSVERSVLYSIHLRNKNVCFLNDITNEAAIPMNVIVNNCCKESFERKLYRNNIQFAQLSKKLL